MKKYFLILMLIVAGAGSFLKSQVTIGSNAEPNANAVLDLVSASRGLLLPRVDLVSTVSASPLSAHVAGMTVYNKATSSADSTYVSPGLYYNNGSRWVRLPMGNTNWFYMPSVSFDTSSTGTGRTKDLWQLYSNQFKTPAVKSTSAPVAVPYIPGRRDLYYYVTEYDTSVFANISIDDNGVMTYDVISQAGSATYINIVFVLK